MVISSTENLRDLLENIKNIGFFGRIFSWGRILQLNSAAINEFVTITSELDITSDQLTMAKSRIDLFTQRVQEKENDLAALKESASNNTKRIIELERESERLRAALTHYQASIQENENELGGLKEADAKNTKRILELEKELERLKTYSEQYIQEIKEKENELGGLVEAQAKNTQRIAELEKDLSLKHYDIQMLINEKIDKERVISAFQKAEQQKKEQYEHSITELNALKKQMDDDRLRLQQEREDEIRARFEQMKATWRDHEKKVEEAIRGICSRHQIEYVDKEQVPFKGKPDNTIKISNEYIVFDAKSPFSDDLENFPAYIKTQAENLKKYIKEPDVNKSLFLVIPSNTLDVIDQFYYNLADYFVYFVTIDTLEPIIMSLKKIEDYEFAEQLSPEERENICRVIGKFAHATKRRIQIDSYFCGEFINILNNCSALPDDILEKTIDFEKADKMNPPLEKRAKVISNQQLKKDVKRIRAEVSAQDIDVTGGDAIEKLPLYKEGEKGDQLLLDTGEQPKPDEGGKSS